MNKNTSIFPVTPFLVVVKPREQGGSAVTGPSPETSVLCLDVESKERDSFPASEEPHRGFAFNRRLETSQNYVEINVASQQQLTK